ncbi:Alw26I/Eco31I/Esp3I family type II restriction endonuclease [Clostridium botulinum]|uniref:Alw26I/Eco31I/Esp3I family type II restriction endonuclease n=1 Tax=Clostridium botulinum TaxID=1491 RepID=A0AAU8Z164_CLOBO|nr:Alw26I/Eco31I/Esp3I family type II restriction endonuclease [Clostridium botulinum]
MSRQKKEWHPNFIKYMNFIANHPNYKGLPITRKKDGSLSWIATAKSQIGQARIVWCENKARELGIPIEPGIYANVMREIHPTKMKVCQTCGQEMSIYYYYPSSTTLKAIKKEFGYDFTETDHISDIWDFLLENNIPESKIISFFMKKGNLSLNISEKNKKNIISELEYICRTKGKKILSPGAMSNFPDRFDGFHTYNRCCRSLQDKGRSKENLKSYTKDRRAYEYWSDGNIHAANNFMGSNFFNQTTADHIGPISLGFIHDPRYLQPMDGSDNSSKRDRLQLVDIEKIIYVESRTGIYPISWYSKHIWEHIKSNYIKNQHLIETTYRDTLKQNMSNFMYILWVILHKCNELGIKALEEIYLKPKYEYFAYSYKFNELGEIISTSPRHFTERNLNEAKRYKRIAIQSVYDYNNKDNRNIKSNLDYYDIAFLNSICNDIIAKKPYENIKLSIESLMKQIQLKLIEKIK